jgi:exodeoxyribonuclease VII small subunit
MGMVSQSPTFEETFGRLQEAIERLEQGGLPLEAALDLFEQSMGLAATCHEILDGAELRLTRLIEERQTALEDDDGE